MINIRDIGGDLTGSIANTTLINNALVTDDVMIERGVCLLDGAILIPSNRTLYLKNCKLLTADEVYDNVFRNTECETGNENIHVIGIGNVVLNDNPLNNYSENFEVYGGIIYDITDFDTYKDLELHKVNHYYFCNVNNYSVKNITSSERKHSQYIHHCTNGVYENIYNNTFTLTRNQGGFQVLYGCNNLTFNGIYGYLGDDFVSVYAGARRGGFFYPFEGFNWADVHDIMFTNMIVNSRWHANIFITGDGNKIYNITYKNAHIVNTYFVSYFGFTGGYIWNPPIQEDFRDILYENITVKGNTTDDLIEFNMDCKNIEFRNIINDTVKNDYIINSGNQSNVIWNGVTIIP